MATIEHRQGEQVDDPQVDADQRQKTKKVDQTIVGTAARPLGNGDGAAQVIQRHYASNQLADHVKGERDQAPGFLGSLPQGLQRAIL